MPELPCIISALWVAFTSSAPTAPTSRWRASNRVRSASSWLFRKVSIWFAATVCWHCSGPNWMTQQPVTRCVRLSTTSGSHSAPMRLCDEGRVKLVCRPQNFGAMRAYSRKRLCAATVSKRSRSTKEIFFRRTTWTGRRLNLMNGLSRPEVA